MQHQSKLISILLFLIKFLLIFGGCYFFAEAMIALCAPGGDYFVPWVADHFDLIGAIKSSLLWGTKTILQLFGIETYQVPNYIIRIEMGRGVRIAHGCVGYGVYSFWIAYMAAGTFSAKSRMKWLAGGLFLLWLINVIRISFLLVALNRNWAMPLGWDHHTWFNVLSYIAIFAMIFIHDSHTLKDNKTNTLSSPKEDKIEA